MSDAQDMTKSSRSGRRFSRRTALRGVGGGLAVAGVMPGLSQIPVVAQEATPGAGAMAAGRAEILWDTWGVPHIFAPDDASLFYGYG